MIPGYQEHRSEFVPSNWNGDKNEEEARLQADLTEIRQQQRLSEEEDWNQSPKDRVHLENTGRRERITVAQFSHRSRLMTSHRSQQQEGHSTSKLGKLLFLRHREAEATDLKTVAVQKEQLERENLFRKDQMEPRKEELSKVPATCQVVEERQVLNKDAEVNRSFLVAKAKLEKVQIDHQQSMKQKKEQEKLVTKEKADFKLKIEDLSVWLCALKENKCQMFWAQYQKEVEERKVDLYTKGKVNKTCNSMTQTNGEKPRQEAEIQTEEVLRRSAYILTELKMKASVAVVTEGALHIKRMISTSVAETKHIDVAVTVEMPVETLDAQTQTEVISASVAVVKPEKCSVAMLIEEINSKRVDAQEEDQWPKLEATLQTEGAERIADICLQSSQTKINTNGLMHPLSLYKQR